MGIKVTICIYCLEEKPLSRAHLWPESIGGHFAPRTVCQRCNSIIGSCIEGRIKENLFFAQSIAKLKLQPKEKAYEKIRITSQETGELLKYRNEELLFLPGKREDGSIYGPLETVVKRTVKQLKEKSPDQAQHYATAIRRGERAVLIGQREYLITKSRKVGNVVYEGSKGFPYSLLAKIAYEAFWAFEPFNRDVLIRFMRDNLAFYESKGTICKIDATEDFSKRVDHLSSYYYRDNELNGELEVFPYHRIDFRLTENGIGYIRIEFFGALPFSILFGPTTLSKTGAEFVNKGMIVFGIDYKDWFYHEFDSEHENWKINREIEDSRAELRWSGHL